MLEALDHDIREHIARETQDNIERGMAADEARYAARRKFGNMTRVKEDTREVWSVVWIEQLLQDVRYGLRMLLKSPGFAAVTILTLALGIGANAAVFSLVDFLVLRPLPIEHPERVVYLASSWKGGHMSTAFSYADFQEIGKQMPNIFSEMTAIRPYQADGVSRDRNSQSMWGSYVAGNFFDAMGIKPALGRLILPSEGVNTGADPVLVVSYAYWKSRFSGDANIVGEKVTINGLPITVVGVAPEGFRGLTSLVDTQGYMPLAMAPTLKDAPADFLTDQDAAYFAVLARLRPGIDMQQAQSALQVVAERLARKRPKLAALLTIRAVHLGPAGLAINPGHPEMLPLVSTLFLGLAASVLVLACMNIANLLLVRADGRQREMAMRTALGATQSRLIRHLLAESVLLALLGGVAGVLLGLGASQAVSSIPLHTSLPVVLDFHFDWRVFAYAFGAALLTGILVGITPALRAARGDVNRILHEGGRTSTSGHHRLRSALVAAQVGGSLMLLVVAGLFVRSLEHVRHSDLGFDPNGILNVSIDPHEAGYDERQAREFFRNLLERARSLPGVQSASLAAAVPMGYYDFGTALTIKGYQPPAGERRPYAGYNVVTPGYLETMRISLLRGREFLDSDAENSPPVAIISQAMADRYWQGMDPIGRNFTSEDDPNHLRRVIGVVRNILSDSFEADTSPFFYVPFVQSYQTVATLQVRTGAAPETMTREVTGLIHSLEPVMPVLDVQPMTEALEALNGFLIFEFAAGLAASLGILGLVLAVVGVYGVISYAASQRTHEIGIRMALGAEPTQILRMIFGQGFVIILAGVLIGLLAAAGMAKLLQNFLIGVRALDPITYVGASFLLGLVALAACYIPAFSAMRVDPMIALRHE
ncbi:MAG: ABC transporter permease [Candidatus Acidiferrum sp.]